MAQDAFYQLVAKKQGVENMLRFGYFCATFGYFLATSCYFFATFCTLPALLQYSQAFYCLAELGNGISLTSMLSLLAIAQAV